MQFLLAAAVYCGTEPGKWFFSQANAAVEGFQFFVGQGSGFVFGLFPDANQHVAGDRMFMVKSFAFGVLPTVIVFSALMSVPISLRHHAVGRARDGSGHAEDASHEPALKTLAAAANIFVGHTEAPLVIKPYLERMTRSELNALMVGGFATVTGSLIAGYASMGVEAGHLITASVISGPASLLIAKLMVPEEDGVVVESSLAIESDQQ